jgi:DHA1 family multidrug resistance protein-like MFS transporter
VSTEANPRNSCGRIVTILGIGTAFSLLGDSTMYTVLPLRAVEIGVPLASVGILLGVNRLVRIGSNTVAGHLYDRLPKRALFVLSLLIGALSTLLCALVHGFVPLLLARILWGLAWSGIAIGSADIILSVTERVERGKWMGIYEMWFIVGSATGSLLGGLETDLLGYRWAMGINAGIAFASIGVVYALLPETGQGRTAMHPHESRFLGRRWGAGVYLAAAVQLASRLVYAGVLASLLSLLIDRKLSAFLVVFGAATLTGGINVLRAGVSVASATGLGRISDRLKDRWLAVSMSLLLGLAGLLLVTRQAPPAVVGGLLLCSIPASSLTVLTRILVGDLVRREHAGRAVSVVQTAGDIGSAAGPPIAFLVVERLDFTPIFLASAGLFGLAALVVLIVRRKLPVPGEPPG